MIVLTEAQENIIKSVLLNKDLWSVIRQHISFRPHHQVRWDDYQDARSALRYKYYELFESRANHLKYRGIECVLFMIHSKAEDLNIFRIVARKCEQYDNPNNPSFIACMELDLRSHFRILIEEGYRRDQKEIDYAINNNKNWAFELLRGPNPFCYRFHLHDRAIEIAIQRGHFEILSLLKDDGFTTKGYVEKAWNHNQYRIVKLLHSSFDFTFGSCIICEDVERLATVKAEKRHPIGVSFILRHHGNVDVFEIVHQMGVLVCDKGAIDDAAERGYFLVVEFLHRNFGNVEHMATSKAIDYAASGGFLDIVEFLHLNRKEGCSETAVNSAASRGDLEMILFLHYNSLIKTPNDALEIAQKYGHHEIVDFLRENDVENFESVYYDDCGVELCEYVED